MRVVASVAEDLSTLRGNKTVDDTRVWVVINFADASREQIGRKDVLDIQVVGLAADHDYLIVGIGRAAVEPCYETIGNPVRQIGRPRIQADAHALIEIESSHRIY